MRTGLPPSPGRALGPPQWNPQYQQLSTELEKQFLGRLRYPSLIPMMTKRRLPIRFVRWSYHTELLQKTEWLSCLSRPMSRVDWSRPVPTAAWPVTEARFPLPLDQAAQPLRHQPLLPCYIGSRCNHSGEISDARTVVKLLIIDDPAVCILPRNAWNKDSSSSTWEERERTNNHIDKKWQLFYGQIARKKLKLSQNKRIFCIIRNYYF